MSLAKKAAQAAVMPEMLVLEKSYIEVLDKVREHAEESFGGLIEQTKQHLQELRSGSEVEEVRRLRDLLHSAEMKVRKKKCTIQKSADEQRDCIQKDYNESRQTTTIVPETE